MYPETSELRRLDEIEALPEEERKKFILLPEHLDLNAQAILEFRDQWERRSKARQRNKIAKESRRQNRGRP